MSEIERFIHLIVSLQILFGSRRGVILWPILVVGLAVGSWFAYNHFFGSDASLRGSGVPATGAFGSGFSAASPHQDEPRDRQHARVRGLKISILQSDLGNSASY